MSVELTQYTSHRSRRTLQLEARCWPDSCVDVGQGARGTKTSGKEQSPGAAPLHSRHRLPSFAALSGRASPPVPLWHTATPSLLRHPHPCFQAVVKETLRCYPIFPLLITHCTTQSLSLDGFVIPPHTPIFINAWAISHSPSLFPDPHSFNPSRFLPPHPAIDVRGFDFRLIPFGAGRRKCVGADLALDMVARMLAAVVHRFHFSLPVAAKEGGKGSGGRGGVEVDMREAPGVVCALRSPLRLVLRERVRERGEGEGEGKRGA